MRYIICDDSEKAAVSLKNKILALEPAAEVLIFTSASSLMFSIEDYSQKVDGIFMDIRLQDDNGISTAERLLGSHPEISLVYVTGYAREYIQDMYRTPTQMHPVAVLTKPIEDKYLRNALAKMKESTSGAEYVPIKTGVELVYLAPDNIISISSNSRKLTVYCVDESYEFYGKLSEFGSELPECFCRCHKSYIINIRHILRIKGWSSAVMSDGTEYPISRTYKEQLKTAVALLDM